MASKRALSKAFDSPYQSFDGLRGTQLTPHNRADGLTHSEQADFHIQLGETAIQTLAHRYFQNGAFGMARVCNLAVEQIKTTRRTLKHYLANPSK